MFYSHQLLARKAPLGQIWMAATMHAKMNRRKLDKLNIIKICEEILNPSVPMALRLSGILMGGVVIVYERKVKLLYDDVNRLLAEINEAWKAKTVPDPTVLPKGKSQANKEAITLPEMNEGDIEQSLQFSNTATIMGFQHTGYFTMRLDDVDGPYFRDGAAEEEDPSEPLHQADTENITLFERYESFKANEDPCNRFERFDIEGDEETMVKTSGDYIQIPAMLIPSPPHQCEPTRADIFEDQQRPEQPVIQQSVEGMKPRQEHEGRGPAKRKRGQPVATAMDYEQTMIPVHKYQNWLQNASDLVSRRGRKKKHINIMSSTKIANLMKLPPIVLIGDLFTSQNGDLYYPKPILDLWINSDQQPRDSPSERTSAPHPSEPSFSSPPGVHYKDFMGFPSEDFDSGLHNQELAAPRERRRNQQNNDQHTEILTNKLRAKLDDGLIDPEATKMLASGKSDSIHSFSESEHGPAPASHSDIDIRTINRSKRRRYSSSGNSSGGLEPVTGSPNLKLATMSELRPTPDYELIVETGPTQTQVKINVPIDKMTDSVQAYKSQRQMKAHFNTPGAPQVESLDILAAGMTRKSAALLFYQTCVLASRDALRVEQKVSYGEILISRG